MKDQDNRIDKNFQPIIERRKKFKDRKNREISHEKTPKKRALNRVCIQRGIRDTAQKAWDKKIDGLVYIDNLPYDLATTPSYSIEVLLYFLPIHVKSHETDEYDDDKFIPFKLPEWKYLHGDLKPYFYQLALSEQETITSHEYRLVPFVLNESKALTDAIHGQKLGRVAFMIDRLGKELKSALNRPVAFWFAFETAMRGQPHYQGSLLLSPDELKKTRQAFYKLNRQMTPRERHGALRFRGGRRRRLFEERGRLYTDLNWADYSLKERATNRYEYADHKNCNRITAASQPIRKMGEDYYNRLYAEFNARPTPMTSLQKRSKSPVTY